MNSDGLEDDRRTAESSRISAEGGRIGAESARSDSESDRSAAETVRVRAESGRKQKTHKQLGAYLLIVVMGGYGFWYTNQVDEDICLNQTENRIAIRDTVIAIDRLGRGLVMDGKPESELGEEDRAALKQFDAFKEEQLTRLELPVCEGGK